MKKGSSSITFFALIVAILLVALAANTFAIKCGSVVVGNITLNESLNGCYNHGLVVEADNIVIDCDNYTIQSVDNQPFGFDQTAGILIKNRDNIEIRNCNINDFQDAILIENSNNNHIHNNHFNLNERSGIFLNRAKDNEKLSYSLITENYFNHPEKFSSDIIIYDNENHNTFTNANVFNNTIFFNNFYGNGIIDITEQNIYCVPNNQEGKGNFFNYTVPMARRITGPCGALPLPFDSPLLNGTVDDSDDDNNQTDGDNETDDDDFSNEDDLPETSLSCGALVSGSIALANDLENCFSTAIEITENNVTLDCQGHTISGTNTLGSVGILVSQQENIVIKNCIIQYFDEGIKIVDSLNVLIESNTIRENSLGITDLGSEDIQIKENTFKENEYAVELEENQNSVVAINKFKENTLVGVHLTKSENIVVGTNEFTENKEAILLSEETDLVSINSNTLLNNIESGIFLTGISEHNEIKNNNIQGSNKCIVLDTSSENLVSENIIEDCNIGISVVGCYDNNITLNSISESVMSGLTYLESQNNWVTKNNFTNSLVGSLDLTNLGFAYNNVVVTNHFLGNGVDDSAIDNIYCWPNNENGVGNYYAPTVADEFIVTGPCGMWNNNQTDSDDNETDDDDNDDNNDDNTDDNDDDNNQTTSSKPNIYDVVITKIDDTSFKITFKTDKDTVSMISYRPDNMERVHMFDYEAKKDHEYILYNLKPCSEYAFYLRVEDNNGNYAYSPNYYFKTEGYCHQRSDGDSLTNSEDVQVLSIAIENEYVQPGDFVQAVLKVKNVGEFDRRRVKISAVIPDMGIVKFITNEHLDDNDKETFKLNIEVPFDTLPGDYWIRFTISNDEIKRVKHRLITVV